MFDGLNNIFNHSGLDPVGSATISRYDSFSKLGAAALNIIMAVSFAISIITLAYAFIQYILSGGNPEKTKKAWDAFLYSVIAGAISIGTLALRAMILRAFGVNEPGITTGLPGF